MFESTKIDLHFYLFENQKNHFPNELKSDSQLQNHLMVSVVIKYIIRLTLSLSPYFTVSVFAIYAKKFVTSARTIVSVYLCFGGRQM